MHATSSFGYNYKQLNNYPPPPSPCRDRNDVLVVEEVAFYVTTTTKTSSLFRRGQRNYSIPHVSKRTETAHRMHFGPSESPFDSVHRTQRDMKLSFLGDLPFKPPTDLPALVPCPTSHSIHASQCPPGRRSEPSMHQDLPGEEAGTTWL